LLKFERLLETYLAFAPRGYESFKMAIPVWLREKLFLKDLLQNQLKQHRPDFDWDQRLIFSGHHLSHAASAFFASPYASAAVLTLDGVGEWATSSLSPGRDNRLEVIKEIHFPHSLGLLYSAFTYYTGFKVNSGEYKLMGLAPYGDPRPECPGDVHAVFDEVAVGPFAHSSADAWATCPRGRLNRAHRLIKRPARHLEGQALP